MSSITVLNVIEVSTLDLALWLSSDILKPRLPVYGPNHTPNPAVDLAPLLPKITNDLAIVTQLYAIIVSVTPSSTSIRSTDVTLNTREMAQDLNKKKDVLYRAIQTLEAMRNTCSGMLRSLTPNNGGAYEPRSNSF